MNIQSIFLTLASTAMSLSAIAGTISSERKQKLDNDWLFTLTKDDKGQPVAENFISVDLPHDWSILNDFDSISAMGNDGGYLPAGAGKYVKTITATADDLKKRHLLYLEGAYMDTHVYVNDSLAGNHPYGYSSVFYDMTPYLKEGDNNITITVDNSKQKNARWYTGSGIYRHVWLYNLDKTAVAPWSLYITTPEVSENSSTVNAVFNITNPSPAIKGSASIESIDGKVLYTLPVTIKDGIGTVTFRDSRLALWSPESPNLYTMTVELTDGNGNVVDKVSENFGVRSISYSATEGFKLNGKPILINGACAHSDNGFLGAKSYDAAEARKVKLLKDAGFNAVRTSHNHPAPAFLDQCDRQGLLVVDEAFDGWRDSKTPHDYSTLIDQWWDKDIEALVARDRNHPSIICWSVGNEVIERKKIEVVKTAHKLAELCRKLDPSRPVTSALCAWDPEWDIYDPLAAEMDIVGYNYMIHKSEEDHLRVPERIMWQTESYPRDAFSNWCKVHDYPYIIGDFVWTGIDYLGESGIGRHYYTGDSEGEHYHRNQWPWHGAFCGDIDLTGTRKPISYYREILHSPAQGMHMAVKEPDGYYGEIKETLWGTYPTWESWTWNGHEGKPIEVDIACSYPAVRLYLNGKVVGEKPTTRNEEFRAVFPVTYQPGTLKAVALDENGNELDVTQTITTAGKPAAVRLSVDRRSLTADNQDLAFVTAEIVDKNGNVVPYADNEINFTAKGNGTVEATGSADIKDTVGYHNPSRKAWKGRAVAIVKASDRPGKISVKATSPALKGASVTIQSR